MPGGLVGGGSVGAGGGGGRADGWNEVSESVIGSGEKAGGDPGCDGSAEAEAVARIMAQANTLAVPRNKQG